VSWQYSGRRITMTEEKVKKMKFSSVITALLCMLIGVVMIVYPGKSLNVICQAFGVVLILGGIICIIFFLQDVHAFPNVMMLIGGVVFAAIGIWIFTKPEGIETIIPFIAGIIIVINGIFNCVQTVELGKAKFGRWWVALILSILTVGLGVLLIVNPFGAVNTIARIIGAFMVYDAVSDLWIIIDISRAYKNIKQEAEALDVNATVEETENKKQG
jgi:uncharacterized membrane protein HdeD (DUF308 family)